MSTFVLPKLLDISTLRRASAPLEEFCIASYNILSVTFELMELDLLKVKDGLDNNDDEESLF